MDEFRRRKLPVRGRRAAEEEEAAEGPAALTVAEVKLLQKARTRRRGLGAVGGAEAAALDDDENAEEDQYGLLSKNFKSQGERHGEKADRHLEEFLEEHLGEKKPEEPKTVTREDSLYAIPEHLSHEDTTNDDADKMNWVTGLVEVSLPLEFKLQNIEDTEKAKRNMLHLRGDNDEPDGSKGGQDADTSLRKKAFGSRFQNFERPPSAAATDDQVLERFRKRMRR